MVDDVDDDLKDRAAQPERPRAADDEPRPSVASDERRRHHARQPAARPASAPAGVEVELAEHVVQVDAGAGNDRRPSPSRSRRSARRRCPRRRRPRCGSCRGRVEQAGPCRGPRALAADARRPREPLREPAAVEVARRSPAPRARRLLAHHLDERARSPPRVPGSPPAAARSSSRSAVARSGRRPRTAAGWRRTRARGSATRDRAPPDRRGRRRGRRAVSVPPRRGHGRDDRVARARRRRRARGAARGEPLERVSARSGMTSRSPATRRSSLRP